MHADVIAQLNQINRQFYETTATDFDQTRGRAWHGWVQLRTYVSAPLRVLDIGCGNGRFGVYLADEFDAPITYHGVDNNAALLRFAAQSFVEMDNLHATLSEHDAILQPLPTEDTYDLVVLFGVIHHVPGWDNRQQFMQRLARYVAEDGLLCFAAWRFYEYERFKKRLVDWGDNIPVEKNDYLLDWRRGEHALRYCHYVDDDEHQALIDATGLSHVITYRADGSDDAMNQYSILQK